MSPLLSAAASIEPEAEAATLSQLRVLSRAIHGVASGPQSVAFVALGVLGVGCVAARPTEAKGQATQRRSARAEAAEE